MSVLSLPLLLPLPVPPVLRGLMLRPRVPTPSPRRYARTQPQALPLALPLPLPAPKESNSVALCDIPPPICRQEVEARPDPRTPLPEPCPRVVVIGAGVAGLSAAAHLVREGIHKVTVLEARSRPGGRLQSKFLGDAVVELGATWATLKHVSDNAVVRRALTDGFLPGLFPSSPVRADAARTLFVDEKGMPLASAVVQRAYQMAMDIEDEQCGQGDALDELAGRRVRLELQRVPDQHRDATARVVTGLLCARRLRSGRDTQYLSQDHVGAYLGLPGAGFRVPLGHVASLEPLLKTLGPQRVRYNKAVETVRWGMVRGQRVVVACEDGEELEADHVIVALPLGVLQRSHAHMFLPGLPYRKVRTIEQMSVQSYNRVFLDYERPFWQWLEQLRLDQTAAADSVAELGDRADGRWLRGVSALRAVQGSSHVLQLDVLGEAAADLELCSDRQVMEAATRYLRRCSGDSDFPEPSGIVRTRWSGDPWSCGAVTEYPTEEDGELLARTLAEPVHHVLFFAGEATNHRYLSTVRGAALSGVREADRVLERVEESRRDSIFGRQRTAC